ncbi:transaldolase family protein [Streptomyces sp. Je 1-369]|uniref:transaldolase family protein n=1 Tax=Streptomyces sp. Je 1-369 TaxID=2966192 RepID=UPI0022863B83|nr:transaldolase family protein [Streptomyces sp. Je 1-369]WAL97144.1 transaldolase [Streptomyces sp. Je 1-369]
MNHAWKRLRAEGVDVWIDVTATAENAAREIRRALAEGEVAGARMGTAHDDPAGGHVTADGIRRACDQLLPHHRASGGTKGLVSVPLPTAPPDATDAETDSDTDSGVWAARARALRDEIDRPNLVVRLPEEAADTATLRSLLALDVAVEVSGVCSPRRYGQVATALLSALSARTALEGSARAASFLSFDVTGVERHVDARLDLIGSDEAKALRGRAGVACARLAHRTHEMTFSSARWGALAAAGTPEPKLLWVTGGASPYRAAHYVQELVTRGTATAMRPAAAHALAEAGTVSGDRVWRHYADAERTLAYLNWFGISMETVAAGTHGSPRTLAAATAPRADKPHPPVRPHRAAHQAHRRLTPA